MNPTINRVIYLLVMICSCSAAISPIAAQNSDPLSDATNSNTASEGGDSATDLVDKQEHLAEKYRRLEELIFTMADLEASTNPRRAALLKKAYQQSKDRLTLTQLKAVADWLSKKQYRQALEGQTNSQTDLQALLTLLLSENRSDRLKSEAQRIKETIKELKRLERIQRSVRGRTEGSDDPQQLAENQQQLADRTGDLADQLEQAGQADRNPSEEASEPDSRSPESDSAPDQHGEEPSENEAAEDPDPQDSSDPESADDESAADKDNSPTEQEDRAANDGDAQAPEPTEDEAPSQSGPPSSEDSPPQKPSPSDESPPGQPSDPSQPTDEPGEQQAEPGEQQVREAESKMREAQQRLEEAKREESIEQQRAAEEKLREAIAELEEILRQMREEEMERVLAVLEGRFRKMLEMEMRVYEGTVRLGKIPPEDRTRNTDIRASKLAFEQRKITTQADRCLALLREEGSSVAFPEVVEQMRDDMQEVDARLGTTKVDQITQGLQEEIIDTLEEMIAALQKAQKDKQQESSEGKPQPTQPGDSVLVDMLAEIKMVRSLQMRVNRRTQRYARLLEDEEDQVGQATDEDLRRAIGKLAERESEIQRITREIDLGRNR